MTLLLKRALIHRGSFMGLGSDMDQLAACN
jgi:hypothetical protein